MEQCKFNCYSTAQAGVDMNVTKVDKPIKPGYKVLDKPVNRVEVKANKTDSGGTFYIYDLFDSEGKCMALDRYVYKNNDAERPFDKLTPEEEEILNPPVEENPEVI